MEGEDKRARAAPQVRKIGLLARLAHDIAGNTLAIMAASLVPLLAMIGSGVDMSRAYLAQNRLQQACDAAALAGRRVMTSGTADATVTAEATKFFNFNYQQGKYQTAAFTPAISATGGNTVIVTASTTMPTTIMKIFGYRTLPVAATCNARQDYVNTDVVLVLDNTGSMRCLPSDSASCSVSYEKTGSKMAGMRSAVMALYDALTPAQTQLTAAGLRLRYGVVPFSGTVNVGKIVYGMNNGYIQNPAPYNQYVCTATNSRTGACTAYAWQVVNVNHSSAWLTSSSWGGCIEEANTVNTITASSGYAIPSGAYDLNVDLVPTTGTSTAAMATQWAPYDESSEQRDTQTACPAQAVPLQAWTRSNLNTYVNGLTADGGTYTDIGMIWGGRMLSGAGIWSSINPTTYGSMPVNKYIILMTDGYIDTGSTYYSAWGVEYYDHRVSANPYPGDDTDAANHKQRFSMVCNAIKGEGVSIWVIGFGQSTGGALDSTLTGCASNANQASVSTDSASLITKFTQIGNAIGALRITQ